MALWAGGFSPPWACATDITDSESEAAAIAAMAVLRMFNILFLLLM
jgi:hypothetical protein